LGKLRKPVEASVRINSDTAEIQIGLYPNTSCGCADVLLKGMGVKDWKRLALERDKWKNIVEEAKSWAVEPRRE
jgi:hypothetical protein